MHQQAALLLDRLVRQGRAFGIHVLLGSQTLGGAYGLARTTMGQMAVRIALQCTETDSQLILADDNTAARLLSRPGEAIYNDAGGLVEGNSPFQVSWLSDDEHEQTLKTIHEKAEQSGFRRSEPIIVFEGNAPSNVSKNPRLNELLEQNEWPQTPSAPRAWIGDPIAIKDPTAAVFRRQHGANMLIVGQRDEAALSMMTASLMGLAAQHRPGDATFYILDGTASDSQLSGTLEKAASMIPHETNIVGWREVSDAINQINSEMQRRIEGHETSAPAIFMLVYGLQRYRMLAKQEEDFSFSTSNEDKPPSPDKQFIDVLRDGPPTGIHSLIWCDAPAALNRSIDRQTLREFDARVLFQMSAGDSSNLIDTPVASKLGLHRALYYSEEKGVLEKFRGYSLAEDWWLQQCRERFASRPM